MMKKCSKLLMMSICAIMTLSVTCMPAYAVDLNNNEIITKTEESIDIELQKVTISNVDGYLYDQTANNAVLTGRMNGFDPMYVVYPDKKVDAKEAEKLLGELDIIDHIDEYSSKVYVINPLEDTYGSNDLEAFNSVLNEIKIITNLKVIGIGDGATFVNNYISQNCYAIAGIMTYGGTMEEHKNYNVAVPTYLSKPDSNTLAYYIKANKASKATSDGTLTTYVGSNTLAKVVANDAEESLAQAFENAWRNVFCKNYRYNNYDKDYYLGNASNTAYRDGYELVEYVMYDDLGINVNTRVENVVSDTKKSLWTEYTPKDLKNEKDGSVPLVILLHGNNNDNRTQPETSGWIELAAKENFMCVAPEHQGSTYKGSDYPDGVSFEPFIKGLEDGNPKYDVNTDGIMVLVDKLLVEYPQLDASRIYVTGLSLGANRSYNVGIQQADRITAVAGHSGTIGSKDLDELSNTNKGKYVPLYMIVGDNDTNGNMPINTNHVNGQGMYKVLQAYGNTNNIAINETPNKNDSPYYGTKMTNQGWEKIGNLDAYVGTIDNDLGTMIKTVALSPYGHWNYKPAATDMWNYFKQFKKDINTGKTIMVDETVLTGTQKAYVAGIDAGPVVTKTIIKLNETVKASSVEKDDFTVTEEKNTTINWTTGEIGIVKNNRTITDAYVSDKDGNKVSNDSNYVTIQMYGSPKEGSPFIYNMLTGLNSWCNPYKLNIDLVGALTTNDEEVYTIDIEPSIDVAGDGKICPQIANFNIDSFKAKDSNEYHYADYSPEKDDKKNALVIWLHGGGEGGSDPQIPLLGNKASNYASEQFQKEMDGAYVLVPQCPSKWMNDETGKYQYGDKGSIYADGLFELIQNYVNSNDDIDKNKIIIGGCSNGGYMTIELLLKHPDYFAAAFPICEAFWNKYITDDQITSIKDIPMWFTYSKTDKNAVAVKEECSIPTIERLQKANPKDLHVSVLEKVVDENKEFNIDGLPYQDGDEMYEYNGHWSWIYAHNNWLKDGTMSFWTWLSKQGKQIISVEESKTNDVKVTTNDKLSTKAIKTGDESQILLYGMMTLIASNAFIALKRKLQ